METTLEPDPRPRLAPRAPRGGWGRAAAWAPALLATALAACGSPAPRPINPEYDLHDPNATRRTQAVVKVEQSRDTSYVPALITRLDDEDESVRLTANRTLKDLTGHDTGYRATMESPERRRHVDLWRAWWAGRGRGTAVPSRPAGPPPAARPAPPSAPCAPPAAVDGRSPRGGR